MDLTAKDILGQCICHESYKKIGRIQPDCAYCHSVDDVQALLAENARLRDFAAAREMEIQDLRARVKELEDYIRRECTFPEEDPIAGAYWFGSSAVCQARDLVGTLFDEPESTE